MSDSRQFSTRNWDIFKAIVAVILFALMIGLSLRVLPFTQPAPAAVLPAGAAYVVVAYDAPGGLGH